MADLKVSPFGHGRTLVVGPSHVQRWKKLLSDLGIPGGGEFIGTGGAPLWSKKIFEETQAKSETASKILLIVGDFRFGNGVLGKEQASAAFQDGFIGIDQSFMSVEHDHLMHEKAAEALRQWSLTFGPKLVILHWTLLGRQVLDRLYGRHIEAGRYMHPTWNLSDHDGHQVIGLEPILRQPMHEAMRLFLDNDLHPTFAGYQFISNVFARGMDANRAYQDAVDTAEEMIISTAREARIERKKIALVGSSIWLDILARNLGDKGLARLSESGVSVLSTKVLTGISPRYRLQASPIEDGSDIVLIEPSGLPSNGVSVEVARKARIIPWEAMCTQVIAKRGETSAFQQNGGILPSVLRDMPDSWVELGKRAEPTMEGILNVLNIALAQLG